MTGFKIKMAELAKKYHISHKRDIDWHNFVAEVEELTHPELAESEDERIIKFLKHAATLDAADELFQEYGVKHTQVIAWLESQKEQEQTEVDLEQEVISYFQGMWPGIDANTTMSFTPPAIMRLVKHFYGLGKEQNPKVMEEVSDNVDKLRAISTPAEEDWFKIAEKWEKEDKHDHASDH